MKVNCSLIFNYGIDKDSTFILGLCLCGGSSFSNPLSFKDMVRNKLFNETILNLCMSNLYIVEKSEEVPKLEVS